MSTAENPRARVEATVNGPYLVTGGPALARCRPVRSATGAPGWESTTLPTGEVYTLCRCGGSARKPFCDGTHRRIGFDGTGPGSTGRPDSLPQSADPGLPSGVGVIDDGPLALTDVGLRRADGSTESRAGMRLCRCGRSADKPFCDGSHEAAGFRDACPPAP